MAFVRFVHVVRRSVVARIVVDGGGGDNNSNKRERDAQRKQSDDVGVGAHERGRDRQQNVACQHAKYASCCRYHHVRIF